MTDEMKAREDRQARLREAMQNLEPGMVRGKQLLLFPTRWERFRLAVVAAIRSEWFNVGIFLALVLAAVLWSAWASAGGKSDLEYRIENLEETVRILSKFHYDAALRGTVID